MNLRVIHIIFCVRVYVLGPKFMLVDTCGLVGLVKCFLPLLLNLPAAFSQPRTSFNFRPSI